MTVESYTVKMQGYTQARRHQRVPADFEVMIRGDGHLGGHAKDLSEAGIGLDTPNPPQPMTLLSLALALPHHKVPVDMLGRVMWRRGTTIGVRFEQNDPRIFDAVERIRRDLARL